MRSQPSLIKAEYAPTSRRKNYFQLFSSSWITLLLLTVFLSQCKKDDFEGETKGICPEVIATDPANGATNVVTHKIITATFNEAMDPATITALTFMVKQGTTPVAGTVSYAGVTATFTPAAPLAANKVYTATITTGAKDPAKSSMLANYVWSFNTGNVPIVVSTDPVNGAFDVGINKIIRATFSTNMDSLTINGSNFMLKQGTAIVPGVVTYSGMTATFTPTTPLLVNTVYTGLVTANVKDVAGNMMAAAYTWSFATGALPTVVSTDPANAATNVALDKIIKATFSKKMDTATIKSANFTIKQGTTNIAGVITYTGMTATFTPSVALMPNTIYTGTISTGVKDSSGNAMAANYVWTFTTAISNDVTPPVVILTDPLNLATGVPVGKKITATFSEAMKLLTINNSTFLLRQGASLITGNVTYSGTTATFSPEFNLMPNTVYTATITTGAQDTSGNPLLNNYTWSFTTAAMITPPGLLGRLGIFGAFGGNAGITNQGVNTIINNGGIGTTAASTLITGFHDGLTNDIYTETPDNKGAAMGGIFTAPPFPGDAASFTKATEALIDANAAYLAISPASKPGGTDPGAGELGGLTLAPGVYKSASGTFKITNGDLTLDAMGDPNAEWIFQTAAGLTVGIAGPTGARSVKLINQAKANNVYWYVGSAAVINAAGGGVMTGNIISSAGVTFSTAGNAVQTVLNGRAVSLVASVTMVNTTINVPN